MSNHTAPVLTRTIFSVIEAQDAGCQDGIIGRYIPRADLNVITGGSRMLVAAYQDGYRTGARSVRLS